MRGFWLLILLLSLSLQAAPVQICVSVYPLADIAGQLVPKGVTVFHIVPPHADPHHFEPTVSIVRSLQQVDLFLGVDPHFDGWIQKFLPESADIVFLKEKSDPDEHIWLSITGGRNTAKRIHQALIAMFPGQSDQLKDRLARFMDRMDAAERDIHHLMKPYRGKAFIQYHPAWDRFAVEMGLTVAGTLSGGHGHDVSPRKLASIITRARSDGTRVVVIGLHKQSRIVDTLVKEIDGRKVMLDAIGSPGEADRNTYPELLLFNADKLAEAFQ